MRAMILAAGRGERMGELTTHVPKPLLRVGEHCLIEYSITNLKRAGIDEIVINISYHAEQIKTHLGDGSRYGVKLFYSEEKERLETGGGIFQALPLLGNDPFIVLSCDVITDFPLSTLPKQPKGLAHLVLVQNPTYHPRGDFGLINDMISLSAAPTLTFANVSVMRPELFANCELGHFRLGKLLMPAIQNNQMTGESYQGLWYNVGTPDDLAQVRSRLHELI